MIEVIETQGPDGGGGELLQFRVRQEEPKNTGSWDLGVPHAPFAINNTSRGLLHDLLWELGYNHGSRAPSVPRPSPQMSWREAQGFASGRAGFQDGGCQAVQ